MPRSRSALLLWAALAAAQAPETASISGTVTDALTGAPILRAHLAIQVNRQKYGAVTDAEGQYSITGIPLGIYALTADRIGYVAYQGPSLELRAGDTKTAVDIELLPTGSITGRVLDADGAPVQLVTVAAVGLGSGYALTDGKGQFRIGGLDPGKYRVRAEPHRSELPPEIRSDGTREMRYRTTPYPARVEVTAGGETSGIEIALAESPVVKVTGKVVGIPPGVKQASVEIAPVGPDSFRGVDRDTQPDGTFVFWGLDPGAYTAYARVSLPGRQWQSPLADVEIVGSAVEGVELRIVPPFDIAGRIQFEDDAARAAFQEPGERQVMLDALDDTQDNFQADLSADGSFQLQQVQPGQYHVSLSDAAYVKSLRLGAAEGDGDVLDVRNGSGGDSLTLVVSVQTGEISGTVSDDKGPVGGAQVSLFAEGRDFSPIRTCDPAGHYEFPHLPPGKYRLMAAAGKLAETVNRNDLWDDYSGQFAAVDIHAGDRLTQDLKAAGRNR